MRSVFSVPEGLPLEEVEGKIVRLGHLNDLRVWRIKRYYIITKEHTESRFEMKLSPVMTGFLHKGKKPRVCFRLSRTGFVAFHWPGAVITILMLLILAIGANWYGNIPPWLILTTAAVILAGITLVTFGFSCTQGGDYVLTHMKNFFDELEQELKNCPVQKK